MKRIWNAIGKPTKDTHFRANAAKQFEKIESGNVKVAAPKVPREQERFETAQGDLKIKEELDNKNKKLVENMEKITIRSIDPPKKENPDKPLPTRESEWEHRHDPIWEFGFYEPPADKIPKGKLMLREALEILRAKQESNVEGSDPTAAKRREIGKEEYEKMKAVSRLDQEFITDMYEYFRPFERKDTQKVVRRKDLAELQDYLKGHTVEAKITDGVKEHVQEMLKAKIVKEEYDRLGDEEKHQFGEAVKAIRSEEHERLMKRLKQINEIEDGIKKAQEAAKATPPKEAETASAPKEETK